MKHAYLIIFCLFALVGGKMQAQTQSLESQVRQMRSLARVAFQQSNQRDNCQAQFVYTAQTNLQDSLVFPVAFSNLSYTLYGATTSFAWDFGDGATSTEIAPVHVYTQYQPYYEVCLTLNEDGCISTFCDTVDLASVYNGNPCFVQILSQHAANEANTLHFVPSVPQADLFCWDFGDGTVDTLTTGQQQTHTYANSGSYTVCLVVYNYGADCVTSTCIQVDAQSIQQLNLGPMTINQLPNTLASIQNILFGDCVDVNNITFGGSTTASIGYFSDSAATIGFDYGLLLTTGLIFNAIGPNTMTGAGTDLSLPGDFMADMLVPGYTTRDAVSINFEFTAQADTIIACEFVFASEEYPEYVGSQFNDVFGFFINGPGTNGWQNIAYIPGTNIPISVNTVNGMYNQAYYVNNSPGVILQYDGYTVPIQLQFPVQSGATYQFRILIADAGDGVYDSGVFIKGGSFLGNEPLPAANFAFDSQGYTVQFTNESSNADYISWSFGDGNESTEADPVYTYSQPGYYNVRMICTNQCYARDTTRAIAVTPGEVLEVRDAVNHHVRITDQGTIGVSYALRQPGALKIELFNVQGQLVSTKDLGFTDLGYVELSVQDLPKGLYVVRLNAESGASSSTIVR